MAVIVGINSQRGHIASRVLSCLGNSNRAIVRSTQTPVLQHHAAVSATTQLCRHPSLASHGKHPIAPADALNNTICAVTCSHLTPFLAVGTKVLSRTRRSWRRLVAGFHVGVLINGEFTLLLRVAHVRYWQSGNQKESGDHNRSVRIVVSHRFNNDHNLPRCVRLGHEEACSPWLRPTGDRTARFTYRLHALARD
jgi:hypothetical protein